MSHLGLVVELAAHAPPVLAHDVGELGLEHAQHAVDVCEVGEDERARVAVLELDYA